MRKNFGPKTMCYPMPVFIIGTYNEDGTFSIVSPVIPGYTVDVEIVEVQ